MNQVIFQLFSRLNVLMLSNDQIIFSNAWDYNESTLDTVYASISKYDIDTIRVAVKTTVVPSVEDSAQLLEELVIGDKKFYCVMDKHDYSSLVGLSRELKSNDLLFYSSLDYYRYLSKGLVMFLDEFSDKEIAAYVFDGGNLVAYDYAVTSSAEQMVSKLLKSFSVANIWNMAKYSIPIPEMETVINFSELSEEQRIALSPSFVTLRIKPSRVVDMLTMMSTIEVDKSLPQEQVQPHNQKEKSSVSADDGTSKSSSGRRSLFGTTTLEDNRSEAKAIDEVDSEKSLFDFNDVDVAVVPPQTGSQNNAGLFDFSSNEVAPTSDNLWDLSSLDQVEDSKGASLNFDLLEPSSNKFFVKPDEPIKGGESLFTFTEYSEESKETQQYYEPEEIKTDTYDAAVHGKEIPGSVEIQLSDVISTNQSNKEKWIYEEPDRELTRTTRSMLKYIYLIIIVFLLFLVYNFLDAKGYIEDLTQFISDLYHKIIK